jgi:superfamily I DNA/RNA helicase
MSVRSEGVRLKPDTTDVQRDTTDQKARHAAVDPSQNIVLEASAGTGKTSVLVERYVNLLVAGVDPDNILAITFTRKAAADISAARRTAMARSARATERYRDLDDRCILSLVVT